jgi:lysophospholipase L1-like esterase
VSAFAGRRRWVVERRGVRGWDLGLALLAALAAHAIPSTRATSAANLFEAEIAAFEAADLRTPPPPDVVLFVGSSTITRWTDLPAAFPGFTVLNRGFGGSQFSDVLRSFDRVVRPYAPPLIVLYEGDNDLAGGRSVDQVFGDWTNFVGRVERELPGTGVLFVSVKPSPSRVGFLGAQRELNRRIAADCAGRKRCRFVDVAGPMLDAAGQPRAALFVSDLLHLNAAGYEVWRTVLGPELESWAGAHPERSVRAPAGALWVDFGSPEFPSGGGSAGGAEHWNNITTATGASNQGRVSSLVATDGTVTAAAWVMTSRFNGANLNGTTAAAPFPTSATRDSLFGNTESFSGLANVTPAFRLTGLRTGVPHEITCYASRTGVGDNRETRYTVVGATTAFADLNVANNVAGVARIGALEAASDGTLAFALSPGPRNNNANHFVYLGALRIEESVPGGRAFLFDVGAPDSPTGTDAVPASDRWNDVPTSVGTDPDGVVSEFVGTDGAATGIGLRMVSRFNAANLEGTTASVALPASATRDSLFGNTAAFGGLADVFPAFRLTGLDPARVYSVAFHASRTGVVDRRETRYVVGGRDERYADLEAANNVSRMAWVTGVRPDGDGEIRLRLEPGPANDNPNRFTYLGALRFEWRPFESPPPPVLEAPRLAEGGLRFRVRTAWGRTCRLERSSDFSNWVPVATVSPGSEGEEIGWPGSGSAGFFRLVDQPDGT